METIVADKVALVTSSGSFVVKWVILRTSSNTAKLMFEIPAGANKETAEELRDELMSCDQVKKACQEHQLTDPWPVDCIIGHSVKENIYVACVYTAPQKIDWWYVAKGVAASVVVGACVCAVALYLKNK